MAQPDKKKSSYQQELERRTNDLLRVYNPLDEDRIVKWDKKNGTKLFRFPKKEEAVHVRYIAEKFIRETYQYIITTKADEAVKEENERRVKAGMATMDKTLRTGEQEAFEKKFYIPGDDKAKEIVAILYMGIETEFGVDRDQPAQAETTDTKPVLERAMETVQEEKDSGVSTEPKTSPDALGCNFPGCKFTSDSKTGMMSHKRSHRKPEDKKDKE
ncbi:hypothetical protein LCGC14_3106480 [marine sediment metagenome]|uniref:C2H2-type domain-containing protein n=1 Tax=marine sediment metagenome TaxID=412755 RepID=A0A0F8W6L7_9ZZZZ